MQLSIYLFDERTTNLADVEARALAAEYEPVEFNSIRPNASAFRKFYYHQPPTWVAWAAQWLDINPDDATGRSLALVLFLQTSGRVFAIPFGYGHGAVDKNRLVRDFGLQAALRVLKPTELSLIDIRNVDLRTRQKRSSLSFKGTIQDFDVAIDNELAFKISGNSEDARYGTRVLGGTPFTFFTEEGIDRLSDYCDSLLQLLDEPAKKDFQLMNRYVVERDEATIEVLDTWLEGQLTGNTLDNLSLAVPELETTLIAEYALCKGRQKYPLPELLISHIPDALQILCDDGFDIDDLYVKGLDDEGKVISRTAFPLRECLVAQTDDPSGGDSFVYILSLGAWHRVNKDFLEEVDAEVGRMPRVEQDGYLPPCVDKTGGEPNYNENVVTTECPTYVMMHTDEFRQGLGKSSVEVCDFYTDERHLICIKPYTCSQTLSHLFAQGSVSARFLKSHRDYREFLRGKAGNIGAFDVDNFREEDFTVVFAIIMDESRAFPDSLPFFSKVNLLDVARNIRGMGFGVSLHRIPLLPAQQA